jgi:hypothetical protein
MSSGRSEVSEGSDDGEVELGRGLGLWRGRGGSGSERDDREEVREEGSREEWSVGSLRRVGGLELESEDYVSENRNGSGVSDADSELGAGILEAD